MYVAHGWIDTISGVLSEHLGINRPLPRRCTKAIGLFADYIVVVLIRTSL